MDFNITGLSDKEHIVLNERAEGDITYLDLKLTADEKMSVSTFRVNFSFPDIDCYSTWSPSLGQKRHLGPNWAKRTTDSRLASAMPVHSVLSLKGRNRMTIAVSDVQTPLRIATGISEETAGFDCYVEFFTVPTTPLKEYEATIRLDRRDIDYCDSIYDVSAWWEEKLPPAHVPEAARLPMNSLWYSFHQALVPQEIVRQCRLSKPLGMDTVIIDDGWQTDDLGRGYAFCGDWELCENKIPDMKNLVEDIHATGMKVMLWYSVPFVGKFTKAYEKFKTMLLDGGNEYVFGFDPRYKEVRDYLTGIYKKALTDWNLDGLKLDFIDALALPDEALKPDPRRDFESLEEAIDVLMLEVNRSLREINPEVLIEFRQSYVGPAIRRYGNMLRVADCPNDAILNRVGIVDMRLTSGSTPVHSDMLMWNCQDKVEAAALQFASVLYSVPQVSVLIDKLSPDHRRMLEFYLNFWREHREVLLDGKLTARCPESSYSAVRSDLEERAVITLYADRAAEDIKAYTVIVNASPYDSVFVKGAAGKLCRVVDCMGQELESFTVGSPIAEISVPTGGMIFLR